METEGIVERAFAEFHDDTTVLPPLTLRGGNAVDGYGRAEPFDRERDVPTDAYLEQFTYWGLGYLDARSWRHYLPRLMDYALRCRNDPAMVIEALIRSLRPPDRYPPRLASLTPAQEAVVCAFLEMVALGDVVPHVQEEAQTALEEWWLPNARCRPTADEVAALRARPITYRGVGGDLYRLELPETLTGGGSRHPRGIAPRRNVGRVHLRRCPHRRRHQRDPAAGPLADRIRACARHAVPRGEPAASDRRWRLQPCHPDRRHDAWRQPRRAALADAPARHRRQRAGHGQHS